MNTDDLSLNLKTPESRKSLNRRALCQLTVCRSDRRKGHKSCALQMVFRSKVTR